MSDVTVVITSCARHDLLRKTLESFIKYNTYPVAEFIIIEDSETPRPEWLGTVACGAPVRWIQNKHRRGQTYSIDRAYSEVKTPYIFHCEDDWEFLKSGFIEDSKSILENVPTIWTVSLRANDCNGHPVEWREHAPWGVQLAGWSGGWGGMNFNPGLRRLADYQKLGSYGRYLGYGTHGFEAELALSRQHIASGFRIAVLRDKYVEHIGEGRSRAADKSLAVKPPKVLIAIPACHKYEYKNQADDRIHKDQVSNARVEAVRNTWAKYMPPHTNADLKFFYGRGSDRTPLADEVFLDVPDDYISLPKKVQAIFQYAVEHDYDYVFKGDDDTFIYVDRLLGSDYQDYDYLGFCTDDPACHESVRYASGGSGYWLSRKAFTVVANFGPPTDWAEDRWVGKILRSHGIKVQRDARYLPGFWAHFVDVDAIGENHSYITMHACSPEMMDKLFAKTLVANFKPIKRAFHEKEPPPQVQGSARMSARTAKTSPNYNRVDLMVTPESAGTRIRGAKPAYKADTLTVDWWDTHKRPE